MSKDVRSLLKRMIELVQPDLRKYYRVPRKGKIVASYPSAGGQWHADVQPLRNDESDDPAEPVLPKLELHVAWGGPGAGIVCPPAVGTFCTIGYWDGDPSYPYIAGIRWFQQNAPEAELKELIIQQMPGVSFKFDKDSNVLTVTPKEVNTEAGVSVTIKAPLIKLLGNIVTADAEGGMPTTTETGDRTHQGSYTLTGPLTVNGPVTASEFIGPVKGCAGCGG